VAGVGQWSSPSINVCLFRDTRRATFESANAMTPVTINSVPRGIEADSAGCREVVQNRASGHRRGTQADSDGALH
jgi:hypothetical protein